MSEEAKELIDEGLNALDNIPSIATVQNLLWKTTPQFQPLITENGVTDGIKPSGVARRFTPNSLSYIRNIRIYGEKPLSIANDITLTIKLADKPPKEIRLEHGKTYAYGWCLGFCEWFEISCPVLFKPKIQKIEIVGASINELDEYSSDIEEFHTLKHNITKYKTDISTELTNLKNDLLDAKNDKNDLILEINDATKLKQQLKNEIDSTTATVDELATTVKDLEFKKKHLDNVCFETKNNTEQLSKQAENLNRNIADLKSQLQKLTSDRNLISDEYGPYVKEGNSQAILYSALITIPLAAIFFSIYQLYMGASNLLTTEYKTATDVIAAFILRIPFAAIFGLAIIYSWKIANAMIQKIFKIHGDRLTLAKLLVVARETVHSSAKNLNITDHEKFQEQTALKIEVLKSHMAKELSDTFTYTPIPTSKATAAPAPPEAVNDDSVDNDALQL
ncbi:hypothetical protein [Pseudomonas brassicacearum]|uniref:hypothetical protein n=1 Tax=Pseudomonas brassicacearum TaxID=930166 RepID=UPI001BDE1DAA|nr:hypothetical protein [Pseudomonas brassicacearum]